MKKILVLASTFPRWKNDTIPPFVFELEKRLAKDFEIHVLAPHDKGAKKYEIMEQVHVHRFQYFWPAKYETLCSGGGILPNLKRNKLLYIQALTLILFELIAAIKLVKKLKIDLIHAHWIIPQGIVAYTLKKFYNISYIVTTHGGDIYGLQNKLFFNMKKVILENAKSITVVSTAIKKEIHKKINPNLKIEVISMGVDSKLFNPNKYDENLKKKYNINGPLLLFVGRLDERKGIKYLLNALPSIIKMFPKTKLLIIGEGPLEAELKSISTDLNLDKNVIFTGPITHTSLPSFYSTADIYIGPSLTEGFGLTFVEAAFSGCIPIGTNVGGIPDIIQNNSTGYLVEKHDSINISSNVLKILNDKKLFKKLKSNARSSTTKKFNWDIISKKYSNVFLQIFNIYENNNFYL
jgi:glycosyltransferase involved in cell wall biosynthesis